MTITRVALADARVRPFETDAAPPSTTKIDAENAESELVGRVPLSPDERIRYESMLGQLLGRLGLDMTRPDTLATPRRMLSALVEATNGYDGDPKLITAFAAECHGGASCEIAQIVEGPIPFYALCEHHAFPFMGRAWLGYVAHEQILGISKLTRLVRVLTRRFGVQERMTHQLADELAAITGAHGVAVYLEAEHLCMRMRGVRDDTSLTRTTAYRGVYEADPDLARRISGDRRDWPVSAIGHGAAPAATLEATAVPAASASAVAAPALAERGIADGAEIHAQARAELDTSTERPWLPTRSQPRGTEPLRTLFEAPALPAGPGGPGTHSLREIAADSELGHLFDGSLAIELATGRPTVVANFATSLDGAVAMDRNGHTSGGDISGFSPTDRFVMGLLRALADTIVVGAGTLRGSSGRDWTAAAVDPARAAAYADLRRSLGLAPRPTTVILTTTGDLDPSHPALAHPTSPMVIAGPLPALSRLRHAGANPSLELVPLGDSSDDRAALLVRIGGAVTLFEGGPRLFGAFLEAGLIDELFLTLSPQLVGRSPAEPRLALVEDAALWPGRSGWADLRSIRQAGSHLLLRYRLRTRFDA